MSKLIDISTKRHPNKFTIIDDDNFADLSEFRWFPMKTGYVARHLPRPGRGMEYMHRRIMGYPSKSVDHINRNPLDNRRSNLRLADKQGNAANMRGKAKCGLKGVTAHQGGYWRARIMVGGRQICLGLHPTPEAAHAAYVVAARHHFGEYACAG